MRAAGPEQKLALKGPITKTFHYVSVELDQMHFYAAGRERTIDGRLYKNGHLGLLEYSAESARFSIWNPDGIYTMRAINGEFYRNPVVVMAAPGDVSGLKPLLEPDYVEWDYYKRPFTDVAPLIEFTGHITGVEKVDDYITFTASRSAARTFPRGRIVSPFANFVPQTGAVINFGSKVIRIESRQKRGKIS